LALAQVIKRVNRYEAAERKTDTPLLMVAGRRLAMGKSVRERLVSPIYVGTGRQQQLLYSQTNPERRGLSWALSSPMMYQCSLSFRPERSSSFDPRFQIPQQIPPESMCSVELCVIGIELDVCCAPSLVKGPRCSDGDDQGLSTGRSKNRNNVRVTLTQTTPSRIELSARHGE
jgi:hypothetical protein